MLIYAYTITNVFKAQTSAEHHNRYTSHFLDNSTRAVGSAALDHSMSVDEGSHSLTCHDSWETDLSRDHFW